MAKKAALSGAAMTAMIALAALGAAVAGDPPGGAASQPASRMSDPSLPPAQPTAEDVMKALEGTASHDRPVVLPDLPGGMRREPAMPGDATTGLQKRMGRLLPEGYRLVDRAGRMVKAGDGMWSFVFEERSKGTPEPAMRLLPCRLLEQMEIASSGGTQSVVFVVSGDVTEYRAANYLLVQRLLIRPNLGNLK